MFLQFIFNRFLIWLISSDALTARTSSIFDIYVFRGEIGILMLNSQQLKNHYFIIVLKQSVLSSFTSALSVRRLQVRNIETPSFSTLLINMKHSHFFFWTCLCYDRLQLPKMSNTLLPIQNFEI